MLLFSAKWIARHERSSKQLELPQDDAPMKRYDLPEISPDAICIGRPLKTDPCPRADLYCWPKSWTKLFEKHISSWSVFVLVKMNSAPREESQIIRMTAGRCPSEKLRPIRKFSRCDLYWKAAAKRTLAQGPICIVGPSPRRNISENIFIFEMFLFGAKWIARHERIIRIAAGRCPNEKLWPIRHFSRYDLYWKAAEDGPRQIL